jgi:hypothetical protein
MKERDVMAHRRKLDLHGLDALAVPQGEPAGEREGERDVGREKNDAQR